MAERSCVIQGSSNPVFAGVEPTGKNLSCSGCALELIRDFDSASYVGFGIKCFGCGTENELPTLDEGEILPRNVVSLGDGRQFLIGGTVTVHRGVVFTVDSEVAKADELTRPRASSETVPFGEALIAAAEAQYDEITGGALEKQRASVLRGISHGNRFSPEENPLVWACIHLRERLGGVDLSDPADAYAFHTINGFRHTLRAWSHHPRFAEVARSFSGAKSFNHNMAVFGTAGYLYEAGNRVTLMPTKGGVRTADLYVRSGADIIRIEVKAPGALFWPRATTLDVVTVESAVGAQLRRIRGQIDGSNHGVLAIATGVARPGTSESLLQGIQNALLNFTANSGVIGVAGLVNLSQSTQTSAGTLIRAGYTFVPVINPNYSGPLRLIPTAAPWT